MHSSSRSFDLLIFDWDGTLADSTALIVHAIQAAFADSGLPPPSRHAASFVIGFGLSDAMRHLAPEADQACIMRVVDAYRHHYLQRDHEIILFEGVQEAMPRYRARGYLLAVATGKSRKGLDRVLVQTGLDALFDITRCADECQSKPHPQMLFDITDYLGVDRQRAVMIGDTTHDLNMAANAGMPALGVSYGAHPQEELVRLAPLAVHERFGLLDEWIMAYG